MNFDGILFDLDGTLWNAVDNIKNAWNHILKENSVKRPLLTFEETKSYMGLQMNDIADLIFKGYPEEVRYQLMQMCMDYENSFIEAHGGLIYDGVIETLTELKRFCPLFIVSNCQKGYIEAFLAYSGISDLFTDWICYGDTKKSKADNCKSIVDKYRLHSPVYVGDTITDFKSAETAGIRFVFAGYGFGDIPDYQPTISDIRKLMELI